jgi:alpha-beta hydrolase superfamily lysophospholipase
MKHLLLPRWVKIIAVVVGAVVAVALLLVAAVYLWPLRSAKLRHSSGRVDSYLAAVRAFARVQAAEAGNAAITADCPSILMNHGHRTARAVVMFHGYHSCPGRFRALAQTFYDAGYNVYVPRQPLHGQVHAADDAGVTAAGLVSFADDAITLGSGLGDEVGVVGLSAGGNLATWSAFYRDDVVKRALLLSPFYEPSAAQTPKWEVKPFLVLYGFGLVPDTFDPNGLSYHGLAQYARIARNYPGAAKRTPTPVAEVLSAGDKVIDKDVAQKIARRLTPDAVVWVPPAEWGLGHDIVNEAGADTNGHAADLFPRYLRLYEGRPAE